MGTPPKRPGGERNSPARLGHDSAELLRNVLRRERGRTTAPDRRDRPVHRPGVVATGTFTASGELDQLTRTPALTNGTSTATVRFSTFDGATWSNQKEVRGMACRLDSHVRAGAPPDAIERTFDLVSMTAPRFIVRREIDFIELPVTGKLFGMAVRVLTRRTTLTAVLTPVFARFLGSRHLSARRYFGVHTFLLEKDGDYRAMRYHWRPVDPNPPDELPDAALRSELAPTDGTVEFDLIVDVLDEDAPTRKLHDPLRRWPSFIRELPVIRDLASWEGTTRYIAGRLVLDSAPAAHPAFDQWVFNPVPHIGGFEASDDEILQARGAAYKSSHVERRAEAAV